MDSLGNSTHTDRADPLDHEIGIYYPSLYVPREQYLSI